MTLSTLPATTLQPKSQLTSLGNKLQNIINSTSLPPFEKVQTYDQILTKYLALKQKSRNPSGEHHLFSEANELWANLPLLPKDIEPQASFSILRKSQSTDSWSLFLNGSHSNDRISVRCWKHTLIKTTLKCFSLGTTFSYTL